MKKIAVIGLGYVGLPLAVEFGKQRPVIGFDISADYVNTANERIAAGPYLEELKKRENEQQKLF